MPTTLYNQYFPYTRFQGQPWYGGHYQDNERQQLPAVLGRRHGLRDRPPGVLPAGGGRCMGRVGLQAHPDRIGIMTTHGYLNESAQRTVHGCTSTQYLWDGLAVPNPNLRFMLSGHVHDESRRTDTVDGQPVFQMLADYQDRASGGEGWLRILRFVPADDKVYVQTYSPWLNRFETDANSEFTLDFPMGGAFEDVGTVTVPSGSTATVTPHRARAVHALRMADDGHQRQRQEPYRARVALHDRRERNGQPAADRRQPVGQHAGGCVARDHARRERS